MCSTHLSQWVCLPRLFKIEIKLLRDTTQISKTRRLRLKQLEIFCFVCLNFYFNFKRSVEELNNSNIILKHNHKKLIHLLNNNQALVCYARAAYYANIINACIKIACIYISCALYGLR